MCVCLPAENNSPLGVAVFNASGPAYHLWKGAELAVSTFWPNYYQVSTRTLLGLQRGRQAGRRKTDDRQENDRQVEVRQTRG